MELGEGMGAKYGQDTLYIIYVIFKGLKKENHFITVNKAFPKYLCIPTSEIILRFFTQNQVWQSLRKHMRGNKDIN